MGVLYFSKQWIRFPVMWREEGRQFQMASATEAKGQYLQRKEWAHIQSQLLKVSRQENNQNGNRWMKWLLAWARTVSFFKAPKEEHIISRFISIKSMHGIKLLWVYSFFFSFSNFKKLKQPSFIVKTPLSLLENNASIEHISFNFTWM